MEGLLLVWWERWWGGGPHWCWRCFLLRGWTGVVHQDLRWKWERHEERRIKTLLERLYGWIVIESACIP